MSFTLVSKNDAQGGGFADTLRWNHGITGSHRILIVGAVCDLAHAFTPGAATFGGAAMTEIYKDTKFAGWYMLNPPLGTGEVAIPWTTSTNWIYATSVLANGILGDAIDASNTNLTPSNPQTVSLTTTQQNDVIVKFCAYLSTTHPTNGAGEVLISDLQNYAKSCCLISSYKTNCPMGANTVSTTNGSPQYSFALAMKSAPGAGIIHLFE